MPGEVEVHAERERQTEKQEYMQRETDKETEVHGEREREKQKYMQRETDREAGADSLYHLAT